MKEKELALEGLGEETFVIRNRVLSSIHFLVERCPST